MIKFSQRTAAWKLLYFALAVLRVADSASIGARSGAVLDQSSSDVLMRRSGIEGAVKRLLHADGQWLLEHGPRLPGMLMDSSRSPLQLEAQKTATEGKPTEFKSIESAPTTEDGAAKPNHLMGAASNACEKINVRRPWSKASTQDRQAFLQAAACLATKPGKFNRNGHQSRSVHEDFVLMHLAISGPVHGQSLFLPCHRLFTNAWFNVLQTQCGYTGDLLYFDLSTYGDDDSYFTTQDLWSESLYGLNSGSVTNGVQQDYRVRYYGNSDLDPQITDRHLQRDMRTTIPISANETFSYVNYLTSDYIRALLRIETFDQFRDTLEYSTHWALHSTLDGDLGALTAPNDVFFYAIHSAVDMIWNAWQLQNNGTNNDKFDGTTRTVDGGARPAQLTDTCPMLDTWSIDFNVADLLDVSKKPNCYRYDFPENLALQNVRQ